MNTSSTDRIERQVLIKAPRKRVWRALTDTGEFGEWFRVKVSGKFVPGQSISGPVLHPGYEHITWSVTVEKMEPERLFSWRWHPNAIDPKKDYSHEPTTLVAFAALFGNPCASVRPICRLCRPICRLCRPIAVTRRGTMLSTCSCSGVLAPTQAASVQWVLGSPRLVRFHLVRPPVPVSTGRPVCTSR